MTNEYGLDVSYFKGKLGQIVRDADEYSPQEMTTALLNLVNVCSAYADDIEHVSENGYTRPATIDEIKKAIHWFTSMNKQGFKVNNGILQIAEKCSHGKGLTEFCDPCGRIHTN